MSEAALLRPTEALLESDDFATEGLLIVALRGFEAISRLYRFELEVAAAGKMEGRDPDTFIGAAVRVVLRREGQPVRTLHGMVASARAGFADRALDKPLYTLEVAPQAQRLSLVRTQEIFMGQSVPEIFKAKLELAQLTDYVSDRLTETHDAREFIVQYRESDLALVSRLTEHWGISFYFVQGDEREQLVLCDVHGFQELGGDAVPFNTEGDDVGVFELSTASQAVPRLYAVSDYNYRSPSVDLSAIEVVEEGLTGGVVEYGGHHKTVAEAERLAKIRADASAVTRRVHEGRSTVAALSAGVTFEVEGYPLCEGPMLVVEVEHELSRGEGEGGGLRYRNRFRAISTELTYRPPCRTPRPRIHGFLTGIIQPGADGDTGGTARLDEYGRYVVQFSFDTAEAGEDKASRRVRMAQPFIGTGGEGMHFPLKPGTEVLLAFADGDPDRPVILGAVPNAETPSPVTAENRTVHKTVTEGGVAVTFGRAR